MDAYNYKNGSKNNWRRFVWNRLEESCRLRKSDACVLYLAGERALDVAEAVRRGFDKRNLIAAETDKETAAALRRSGLNVVPLNIAQALMAWPNDRPLAAVLGDFQGGIHYKGAFSLGTVWASHPACDHAMLLVNMLRGRANSPALLAAFKRMEAKKPNELAALLTTLNRGQPFPADSWKHRGAMLTVSLMEQQKAAAIEGHWPRDENFFRVRVIFPPSYMSSNNRQRFDSVLLQKSLHANLIKTENFREASQPKWRRILAAAFSVRTQRLSGYLPH